MNKNLFPQNLKYLLDTNQITTKTILQLTGNKSPGLVTMWKNEERQITIKDLLLIANYLNYTIDELVKKDLTTQECNNQLNNLLNSEIKELTDNEKRIILQFIETIHKNIGKELDNWSKYGNIF